MRGRTGRQLGDNIVLKYMYLQDPAFRQNRTMTIARKRISDTEVEIAYSINRIEKSCAAYQDQGYVPYEHVFDAFSKKKGRTITEARMEKGKVHVVTRELDERFEDAILKFLHASAPDFYAKKLAGYYLSVRQATKAVDALMDSILEANTDMSALLAKEA